MAAAWVEHGGAVKVTAWAQIDGERETSLVVMSKG
jgi:hypothetical protein